MNTSVLSEFVTPAIPYVAKYGDMKAQDSVLVKRSTVKITPTSTGPFSSNGSRTITFSLPSKNFLDFSALRLLFTIQAGDTSSYIQDMCPLIRSVQVMINGQVVESITNFYSLFQNMMYYYSAHDSTFQTQLARSGAWQYGTAPKPSDLFKAVAATAPAQGFISSYSAGGSFTETYSIPLSLLGLCRSKKLFPACLMNAPIQIVVELAAKEQVFFTVTPQAQAVGSPGNNNPTSVGTPADYSILQGSTYLLYDSVETTQDYTNEVLRVAGEGTFSYIIDTFDIITQSLISSLNNIILADSKTKLKDLYCIFKPSTNSSMCLSNTYFNPLVRRFQLTIGDQCYPTQAIGGRTSGTDCDILSNIQELYDQTLLSLNELGNVLSMGVVPFKVAANGCCNNTLASALNYQIALGAVAPLGTGVGSPVISTSSCYAGAMFMLGMNLEANLSSMMSGTDTKQSGGIISITVELENTPGVCAATPANNFPIISSSNAATMMICCHFDRQIIFSKGVMSLLD